MSQALADTSSVIAAADGRVALPDETAISVITLGELHAGIQRARDVTERMKRLTRLRLIRSAFDPIPVDEAVAEQYGRALALAREERRGQKATDLLIVGTAAATNLILHTRDAGQAKLARRLGLIVHGPGA